MNQSNDLLDPRYPELSKIKFMQRMNHYNKMMRWLLVANIAAWSAAAYIAIKWLSI